MSADQHSHTNPHPTHPQDQPEQVFQPPAPTESVAPAAVPPQESSPLYHEDEHQPPMHVVSQPEPERILYQWESPSRPYKKRSREFYSTVAAIIILLTIILLFAKEFMLLAVILSVAFLAYVLASVEPDVVPHIITNKGIRTSRKLYPWQVLGRFWWDERWKQKLVKIETPFNFPGQLIMLLGQADEKHIDKILSQYLLKEKPEPTWADRSAEWLQRKVPLETDDE